MKRFNVVVWETNAKIRVKISSYINRTGEKPKYIFMSNDAFDLIADDLRAMVNMEVTKENARYMGIEVVVVDVPGVYASVGEGF